MPRADGTWTPAEHAACVDEYIDQYAALYGSDVDDDAFVYFLTDLMHAIHINGHDVEDIVVRARRHFNLEADSKDGP